MNTDELLIIVDAIRGLGDSGITAFLWWVAADKGSAVLTAILVLGFFAHVTRVIARSCVEHSAHVQAFQRVYREAIGAELRGELKPLTVEEVIKAIRRMKS